MVARRRHKHNGSNISMVLVVKIWATANRLRNELGLENDAIPYGFYTAVKNKLLQNGERLAEGTIKLWLLREKTGNTNQLSRSGRPKHSISSRSTKHRARKRLKNGATQTQVAHTFSCCRTTLRKYTRAGSAGLKFYRLQGVTPLTELNKKDRRRYARWRHDTM